LVSGEFPTFDVDPGQLDARWLSHYLRSPARWSDLASLSKGLGVRRQRVPVESVLGYRVWLPPIEEQQVAMRLIQRAEDVRVARSSAKRHMASLVRACINECFKNGTEQ
jgi:hypothetical protein